MVYSLLMGNAGFLSSALRRTLLNPTVDWKSGPGSGGVSRNKTGDGLLKLRKKGISGFWFQVQAFSWGFHRLPRYVCLLLNPRVLPELEQHAGPKSVCSVPAWQELGRLSGFGDVAIDVARF